MDTCDDLDDYGQGNDICMYLYVCMNACICHCVDTWDDCEDMMLHGDGRVYIYIYIYMKYIHTYMRIHIYGPIGQDD